MIRGFQITRQKGPRRTQVRRQSRGQVHPLAFGVHVELAWVETRKDHASFFRTRRRAARMPTCASFLSAHGSGFELPLSCRCAFDPNCTDRCAFGNDRCLHICRQWCAFGGNILLSRLSTAWASACHELPVALFTKQPGQLRHALGHRF